MSFIENAIQDAEFWKNKCHVGSPREQQEISDEGEPDVEIVDDEVEEANIFSPIKLDPLQYKKRPYNNSFVPPVIQTDLPDPSPKPKTKSRADTFHSFLIPSHTLTDPLQLKYDIRDLKRQLKISENHSEFLKN